MLPPQPIVCRQGGHDGWSSGDGGGDRWTQSCRRAGHQDQPGVLQGPQCGRGSGLHGENGTLPVSIIMKLQSVNSEHFLFQANWNMSMLQTEDVMKSAQASMEKKSPKTIVFSKL